MCQVLFSESANPPRQALVDGNAMNKDGFGFAWSKDKQVSWSKGFNSKELTEEMIDHYMALPFPKAIHFRLATHGGTTQALTHPFPIKRGNPHDLQGNAKSVLFHNGIWHAYDDRLREAILAGTLNPNVLEGGMSDSRAMAVLAQRFGVNILDVLNLGSNKVLILTGESYIQYGSWTEKEGWSASSSRIFRVTECGRGKVEKGVVLGPSGLPLTAAELSELGRKGHLNRHGNLRSKFRGGSLGGSERDMGPTSGEVDDARDSYRSRLTERPTQGSLYLSASMEQIKDMQEAWGIRERMA
jgi:hypothetical protein